MANEIIKGILRNNVDVDMVYHYTDLESLKGILRSKSLWLSHVAVLSGDKNEFDFGIDYIIDYLSKIEANNKYKEDLRFFGEALKAGKETPICVGSLCEIRNLKSQWDKFGRVAIGFRVDDLQKICDNEYLTFGKVIYQDSLRNQCIVNLANQEKEDRKVSEDWFKLLQIYIAESGCFFKREENYRDEHEVRIVTNPSVSLNKRMKGSLEVSYYSLPLLDGKGAFLKPEIVIGSDPNQSKIYDEVNSILTDCNITDCEVSYIP